MASGSLLNLLISFSSCRCRKEGSSQLPSMIGLVYPLLQYRRVLQRHPSCHQRRCRDGSNRFHVNLPSSFESNMVVSVPVEVI